MRNVMLRNTLILLLLAVVATEVGCVAGRDYAKVRRNYEVDKIIRTGDLQPGYRYYYNGPDGQPTAVMALAKEYELKSRFWHEFRHRVQLQRWINEFDQSFGHFDDIEYVAIRYKGHEILDRENRRIGMIYSRYDWVVAWWGEANEIYVTQPEPAGHQRAPFMRRRFFFDD